MTYVDDILNDDTLSDEYKTGYSDCALEHGLPFNKEEEDLYEWNKNIEKGLKEFYEEYNEANS